MFLTRADFIAHLFVYDTLNNDPSGSWTVDNPRDLYDETNWKQSNSLGGILGEDTLYGCLEDKPACFTMRSLKIQLSFADFRQSTFNRPGDAKFQRLSDPKMILSPARDGVSGRFISVNGGLMYVGGKLDDMFMNGRHCLAFGSTK